ncbi:uncharacterized protein DEA37_0007228 [Paragonimus westermani]|uniref:G-protein coupled receptors family 2 profile 2 domain-containing protein n=1 Tax=Paragonimus westermani TaxID=34504 RepID=A0A5J4P5C0_9TREM|nr:uncharacterized protein DEA37_0007228 [Paragonimus westermani]
MFSSENGILKAEMLPEEWIAFSNNTYFATVYYQPNDTVPINFFICKKRAVRNGTCLIQYTNGTFAGDHTNVKNGDEYYQVTGIVKPDHVNQYECFVNIDGIFHLFSVAMKRDLDECKEAANLGVELCHSSNCVDLSPGYMCEADDYTDNRMCNEKQDWFCPHTATYDRMSSSECPSNKCVDAANKGVQLCDVGVHDCVNTDITYRCRRGVPLLDICNSMQPEINLSCPKLSNDTPGLERYGSNVYRIAYNAKALHQYNPEYLLNLTKNLTDERINIELDEQSDMERQRMANQLIDTLEATLEIKPPPLDFNQSDEFLPVSLDMLSNDTLGPRTVRPAYGEKRPSSPTNKVKYSLPVFHLLSTIARKTPSVRNMLDTGAANRKGLQFMRLGPGRSVAQMNNSKGSQMSLMLVADVEADSDSIIAMFPASSLIVDSDMEPIPVDEEDTTDQEVSVVESDIVVIDTVEANSTYQLTMNLVKKPEKSPKCQQLRHTSSADAPDEDWSEKHCETIVVGMSYQCRCTPKQTGTFAIALVYWIGGSKIPTESMYLSKPIEYLLAIITILALLLFLIFTRFIGVFRLDQFNIAFCLLLSAIVTFIIPHVTAEQPIACTIVAIIVCFFPLAAFSWKLIFGLNTLMLIIAPNSRYHDWVSRQQRCVPLVWIGYLIPAIIVGAWFGYAERVDYNNYCIGPAYPRWAFVGPITAVVIFNFFVLVIVSIILLRSYLLTRKSRINKSTHLLVLTQLMLTLGIPYIAIYVQFLHGPALFTLVPIAMALTAVLMFLLVAVIDEASRSAYRLSSSFRVESVPDAVLIVENRHRLHSFLKAHFTRSSTVPTNPSILNTHHSGPKNGSFHGEGDQDKKNNLWKSTKRTSGTRWNVRDRIADGEVSAESKQHLNSEWKNPHKQSEIHTQLETPDAEVTFEPGWLHRYPVTSRPHNGADSVVINEDSLNTVAFNRMALTTAPRTSLDTDQSTTSPAFSGHSPDTLLARPLNSNESSSVNSPNWTYPVNDPSAQHA